MAKVFLIHGWEGSPEEGWRPWLKGELENKGFEVHNLSMPDTDNPRMEAWVSHLGKAVGKPSSDCYFVGHSLGCITILRYLETIEGQAGGAVMVAGFASDLGYEEIHSFFTSPILWDKIKARCKSFAAINSDNDPYVSLHYGDMFKEKLGARVIVKHGMRHFSGEDGITELPDALECVLMMSRS
jgi:predicted alpha/beta hydrolase family esterase